MAENFIYNQYDFLYRFLKDSYVLDIGAYIGDTAILFCKKGAKKVYAFELHPLLFEICKKNIELNNLEKNIEFFNYGVSDVDKRVEIYNDDFCGPTGTFGYRQINSAKKINIELNSLAKLINKIERIDILKMDCEGAEFEPVLSCNEKDLRKIKVIAIEYHKKPTVLIEYLKSCGFQVVLKEKKIDLGFIFAINNNQ